MGGDFCSAEHRLNNKTVKDNKRSKNEESYSQKQWSRVGRNKESSMVRSPTGRGVVEAKERTQACYVQRGRAAQSRILLKVVCWVAYISLARMKKCLPPLIVLE
jgi:hypothetical protein